MASSSNNPAVFERQLKKIYDCLNIGSNKKAVQEVDRLPKNIKDLTVFKALKALALIRMGKRRQAFEILEEIDPHGDLDDVTLQTMTSCYKESVDIEKIVILYESAASKKPDDPEIMAHLFMAYVRVFNFKRQKEIALQMYRKFPNKKRLYSFWAIMSLVMQSQDTRAKDEEGLPIDKKVCLTLAEKMCEKMIDDERSHEEIELYLMILKKQQKHLEEYRFLTGQYCLRITDHLSWFNRRRAYLCLDLKMYSRAFKHYFPTLIQEYPDQIEYYEGLFKSAFLLDTEVPPQQQMRANLDQQSMVQVPNAPVKPCSALAECYDIVEKQCQMALESNDLLKDQGRPKDSIGSKSLSRTSSLNPHRKRLLRGPFMARIELYHIIQSKCSDSPRNVHSTCLNLFSSRFNGLVSLLLDFFQSFSKKIICYYDMDYMLTRYKLSQDEIHELLKSIDLWIGDLCEKQSSDTFPYDMFHIKLNYHMLEHSFRPYAISDSKADRLCLARKYIDLYNQHRELGKQSKTDFLPVDHYCLLAINSIMTNAIQSDLKTTPDSILSDNTLISLIVLAEDAISANSPSNHQIKLLLLKMYSFIGASKQSSNVLLGLDIKHFQIDTLGHLLNPVLYNTGNYTLSKESLEACSEFYTHGVRECFEGLTTSYRDGKFSKIEEISGVLKRLSNSLNATQCAMLKGIVSNLNAATMDDLIAASHTFDQSRELYRKFEMNCCENEGGDSDTLKDSRDFKVLKSLHFEVNESIEARKLDNFEDEGLLLRLRYFTLRCVYQQVSRFLDVKPESKPNGVETRVQPADSMVDECIVEMKMYIAAIEDRCSPRNARQMSFLEPEASPFRWPFIRFITLCNLIRTLVECKDLKRDVTEELQTEYLNNLVEIADNIDKKLSSIASLIDMKQALMLLTISLEFISLCVTSLVCMMHKLNKGLMQAPDRDTHAESQHNQYRKSIIQTMVNKTEAQLTRLSTLIKSIDIKALSLDKITQVDEDLVCEVGQCGSSELKSADSPAPIMTPITTETLLTKVKEKIFDSYADSLREIESTVRRKAKLLRAKA